MKTMEYKRGSQIAAQTCRMCIAHYLQENATELLVGEVTPQSLMSFATHNTFYRTQEAISNIFLTRHVLA